MIVGLCDALQLDDRHALLSAYAYSLIDGEVGEALLVAQAMLRRRYDPRYRPAYEQGLRVAVDLIALIESPEIDSATGAEMLPKLISAARPATLIRSR